MEYFRAEAKVGGFIFVVLVLLVIAALTIGDLGYWVAERSSYTVLLRNAHMLPIGARVSYAGYALGEIRAIEVRPLEARARQYPNYFVALEITIRSTIPLREDSYVEIKSAGIIGDLYLDIMPGTGKPIPPGGLLLGASAESNPSQYTIGSKVGVNPLVHRSDGTELGEFCAAFCR